METLVFWSQLCTICIAGGLLIFDQQFGKPKYRKLRIWLAVSLLILNFAATFAADRIIEVENRERKADLMLIMKQDTGLHRLGIEFVMREVNNPLPIENIIHLRTWILTPSFTTSPSFPFTTNLDVYYKFFFSDYSVLDSISPLSRIRKATTEIVENPDPNTIQVWFNEFGLENKNKMYWKPESISELQYMNISFVVTQNDYGRSNWYTGSADLCPIEKIRIYANEFKDENLLVTTKLISNWNRKGGTNYFGYYPEMEELGPDSSDYNFNIDPLWLRQSLLKSLNNK